MLRMPCTIALQCVLCGACVGFIEVLSLVSVEDKKASACDVIYNNLAVINNFDQQVPLVCTVDQSLE
jgi:hypothetical protein